MISTDEKRLMQVLLNLTSNALKFTVKGSVKMVIEIINRGTQNDSRKCLKVQVVDTGVGISDQNQQKLFKLFGFVSDTKSMNT